jgi:hypothetical protein
MAANKSQMNMFPQTALMKNSTLSFEQLNEMFGTGDIDPVTYMAAAQEITGISTWPLTPPRSVRTEFASPANICPPQFTYSLPEAFATMPAYEMSSSPPELSMSPDLVLGQPFQPCLDGSVFVENTMKTGLYPFDANYDLDVLFGQMDENTSVIPVMGMNSMMPTFDFSMPAPFETDMTRRLSTASAISSMGAFPELGICNGEYAAISESNSTSDLSSLSNCPSLISPDVSPKQASLSAASVQNKQARRASFNGCQTQAPQAQMPARVHTFPVASQQQHQLEQSMHMFNSQSDMSTNMQLALQQLQSSQPSMPNRLTHGNTTTFIPQSLMGMYSQMNQAPSNLSHGHVNMLQSDLRKFHSAHYLDNNPPDLYASLRVEQSSPPPEDMNPEDPEMIPHEQELRFEGDLYTPRWVRGNGNKREGWCGLCKPGRWLVLKNSAFWYDKSFSHGVSAATGAAFSAPEESRRMDGNPDVWEGLCGSCHEYVPLVSSKKKGTTWFRHAYKVCFYNSTSTF